MCLSSLEFRLRSERDGFVVGGGIPPTHSSPSRHDLNQMVTTQHGAIHNYRFPPPDAFFNTQSIPDVGNNRRSHQKRMAGTVTW